MTFDRFDVCEAYYQFAVLYHGGQFSPVYRIFGRLSRIDYSPGMGSGVESLSKNAREIFDALIDRHGFEPYEEGDTIPGDNGASFDEARNGLNGGDL